MSKSFIIQSGHYRIYPITKNQVFKLELFIIQLVRNRIHPISKIKCSNICRNFKNWQQCWDNQLVLLQLNYIHYSSFISHLCCMFSELITKHIDLNSQTRYKWKLTVQTSLYQHNPNEFNICLSLVKHTSPALTVMTWGVKFVPTEFAAHSPKKWQSINTSEFKIKSVTFLTDTLAFFPKAYVQFSFIYYCLASCISTSILTYFFNTRKMKDKGNVQ